MSSKTTVFTTDLGIFECDRDEDKKMTSDFELDGAHQRTDILMLLDHITTKSTVVDAGAHIGTFSIPLAKKASIVHSFEPMPYSAALLASNIKRNNLHNVVIHNCALSNQEEKRTYQSTGGGTTLLKSNGLDSKITTRRLDDFSLSPDLIKIDCEGMELAILEGARETIKRSKPILFFEIHRKGLRKQGASGFKIEWYLRKFGYTFYKNKAPKNAHFYTKKRILTLFQGGPFFNVLAIPKKHPLF